MAFFGQFIQYIDDPCLCPDEGMWGNPHVLGDLICCDKSDAVNILSKVVGVSFYHFDGTVSVLFVNLGRIASTHSVALKKDHNLFDLFLLLPSLCHHPNPFWAVAVHLGKPFWCLFYNLQGVQSEFLNNPLCHDWTNAFD